MANDNVIDQKVVRAVDPSGNILNLRVDANGNLQVVGGGGGGTSTVKVADGTTPSQLLAVDSSGRIPVNVGTNTAGVLTPTADATVAGVSGTILAANANRKGCMIQNVGTANIRVGTGTVTATTGLQVVPGAILILESPFCPVAAITAIRESSISSTVAVAEIV